MYDYKTNIFKIRNNLFRDLKAVPIISASRWLVKKGNVTKICLRVNTINITDKTVFE